MTLMTQRTGSTPCWW